MTLVDAGDFRADIKHIFNIDQKPLMEIDNLFMSDTIWEVHLMRMREANKTILMNFSKISTVLIQRYFCILCIHSHVKYI